MALSVGRMTNPEGPRRGLRAIRLPRPTRDDLAPYMFVGMIAVMIGWHFYLSHRYDAEHPLSISRFEVRGVDRFFLDQGDDFEAMVPNGTGGFNKVRYRAEVGPTEYRNDVPAGGENWFEGVTYTNSGSVRGPDGIRHDVDNGGHGSMVVHYGGDTALQPGTVEKGCKTCAPTHQLHDLR